MVEVYRKNTFEYPIDLSKHWKDMTFIPKHDLKLSMRLDDGNIIEGAVFRLEKEGKEEEHVCISTQVGCRFGCEFCTSGKNGFVRNLTSEEILKQIELLSKEEQTSSFDCILFMGIGEPLDNFDAVTETIRTLVNEKKLYTGKRKISVATNGGKIEELKRLSELDLPIELLVSLHAIDNSKRNRLMPINKAVPVEQVLSASEDYANKTKSPVLLNYMLFPGFNDTDNDLTLLASYLEGKTEQFIIVLTEPNNDIEGYKRGKYEDIVAFEQRLRRTGIKNKIYRFVAAGKTIGAGCGEFIFTRVSKNHST